MNHETIVTFGKYKGQPLSVLTNDNSYFVWCQQQPWFQKKFPKLCMVKSHTQQQTQHTPQQPQQQTPQPKCESVSDKIKLLTDENINLTQKIAKNKEEIERLKKKLSSSVMSDNDNDATVSQKYVVKCLL